jgi:hypothetical protein
MSGETQKTIKSTTTRISCDAKDRLKNVVRYTAVREKRDVSELEIADRILIKGLADEEIELGIKE